MSGQPHFIHQHAPRRRRAGTVTKGVHQQCPAKTPSTAESPRLFPQPSTAGAP
ncbi:hypothetical protein ACFXI8_26730 [Streptomyces niveus]|uniref:hypothetical protein n=1 Tax=Streptomyces niveus TaxID=193462 RepID=UPI0036810704